MCVRRIRLRVCLCVRMSAVVDICVDARLCLRAWISVCVGSSSKKVRGY